MCNPQYSKYSNFKRGQLECHFTLWLISRGAFMTHIRKTEKKKNDRATIGKVLILYSRILVQQMEGVYVKTRKRSRYRCNYRIREIENQLIED